MKRNHSLKTLELSDQEISNILEDFDNIPISKRPNEGLTDELNEIASRQYAKVVCGLLDWLPSLIEKYPQHKNSVHFIQQRIAKELKALKVKKYNENQKS